MTFHSVGNFIIPTDELIFFRGVGQPPTSNDDCDVLGIYQKKTSPRLLAISAGVLPAVASQCQ